MTIVAAESGAARASASRGKLLSDPRSGARPLGNSDPGPSYSRGSQTASKPPAGSAPARPSTARRTPVGATSPQRSPAKSQKGSAAGSQSGKGGGKGKGRTRSILGQSARTGRQFTAPEFHNYQGIILAEFILAELLVAGTPIATRQEQPGLSPYVPRDMTKLLSIGMVYFLLELMAVGGAKTGRLGAWFGGLVLLGVGLNEGANVAKTLDLFGGIGDAAAKAKDKFGGGHLGPPGRGPAGNGLGGDNFS